MIARARTRGLDVSAEEYPYRAAVIAVRAGEMDRWSDQEIHEIQPMEADERLTRESSARYRDRDFEGVIQEGVFAGRPVRAATSKMYRP